MVFLEWGCGAMDATKGSRRFVRPVVIRAGGTDKVIADVNAAAEVLLRSFPSQTARRKTAMAACLKALRGEAHALSARRAFVAAALEVGILAAD